ncbi:MULTISPECIES: hypothetical protein [Sphingobacterium]|uniref:DUF4836 family protein n=1 Tax=Sphingobacterium populi TaxID=1812824 RepID=A0ABW5UH92_9SPHI|nr:hypothetical protein [Sphingobacterium sp. CFCC 11742]
MKIKTILTTLVLLQTIIYVQAQDLIHKVPAEANVLVTINTKAVFKHLDIADVDAFFQKVGILDSISTASSGSTNWMQDSGIDYDSKAYFYMQSTDSVQFFGSLIPLMDAYNFEKVVGANRTIETVNGLKSIYNRDRTIRLSWDDNTAYVLGANFVEYYFEMPEIRERYGLPEPVNQDFTYDYPAEYDDYVYEVVTPADSVYTEYDDWVTDTVKVADDWNMEAELSDTSNIEFVPAPPIWSDAYDEVDSILAQDEYADDYYLNYRLYTASRDSMIHILMNQWIDIRMEGIISGKLDSYAKQYKIGKMADDVIADLRLQDFGALYQSYLPAHLLYSAIGMGRMPKMNYGVEMVSGQLVVQGKKLLIRGDASLDKEMSRYLKAIYSKKMNRKFLPHLNGDILGFMSFKMDTESYIKYMPQIFQRYYGPMVGKYDKYVDIVALFFDIILDEKAIAKVFKGDNLLVLHGITPVEVSYTDYVYDEDYNYEEVEKTKIEQAPDFLWMFSSDDTRIFENLLEAGESELKVDNVDGVYNLPQSYGSALQLHLLIKDGIVYVGTNQAKLQEIKMNKFRQKGHKAYMNIANKDAFSVVFNTKRAPELFDRMGIPVAQSMRSTIEELGQYGDFVLRSSGVKRNKISAELSVDFPDRKGNALAFLFGLMSELVIK